MRQQIEESFKQYQDKLLDEYNTLIKSLDDAEILLKELFVPDSHQAYYNYANTALRKEGVMHHDLQKYLASKVKEYFHAFDDEVEIEIAYPSSYPSDMSVKYKGYHVLTFSFYYHEFTNRVPRRQVNYLRVDVKRDEERIKELRKKISEYQLYSDNLMRVLSLDNYKSRGIKLCWRLTRDIFTLARVGSKKAKENIRIRIDKWEKQITDLEDRIKERNIKLEDLNEAIPRLEDKYKKWEEKLLSIGYKEPM